MFEKFIELLAALPVNAVLRIEGQRLIRRVEELEAEVSNLKNEIAEKDSQLAKLSAENKFVKFRGVRWEPDGFGGYATDPICPTCDITLCGIEDFFPLRCSSCHFLSPFTKGELESIYDEMLKKHAKNQS